MALALPACGMKGDLYLPPETPEERVTAPDPAAAEPADKGERRTIPATPDPALSR
ncbi:MAG: lipoprotein [Gammaproteobacteria bacterium]